MSQNAYRSARSRTRRKRWAGVLARGGVSEGEQVPHLAFGDHGDRFLLQFGSADGEHGVFGKGPAFHQPVEEPVQATVLGVDMPLGELPGFSVDPFPEPPHPVLEVREVVLQVPGGDFLYVRPPMFLSIEGDHSDRGFEAREVPSEYRLDAFRLLRNRFP